MRLKIDPQRYFHWSTASDSTIVREYEELPTVYVDKHKLMEILVNLIQNATQATRGTDTRRLTVRVLETTEGTARIEVEDTGMGIPVENLDLEQLAHDLKHLIAGESIQMPNFNFVTGQREIGEVAQLDHDQIIIMEGIHGLNPQLTEMKATLGVASEGPGTGATFTLDIPMSKEEATAA